MKSRNEPTLTIQQFSLIIVVVLITLGVVLSLGFRDAKATHAETITDNLIAADVDFMYTVRNNEGTLYLFNFGTKTWSDATEACKDLIFVDNRLNKVIIPNNLEANSNSEIRWSSDKKTLTNLDGRNEAICK